MKIIKIKFYILYKLIEFYDTNFLIIMEKFIQNGRVYLFNIYRNICYGVLSYDIGVSNNIITCLIN